MNEQPNMDKRLRQLENQSLPDLSRQDEHWQGMKQLLQAGSVPAAKPVAGKTFWYWLAAAASVSAVVIYFVVRPGEKKKAAPVTATVKEQAIPQEPASYPNDTVSLITAVSGNETNGLQQKPRAKNSGTSFLSKAKTQHGEEPVLEARLADKLPVATKTDIQDPKASLAAFFAQLEKPVQQYLIDNRKDTLLWGGDGTALLIPANTFNTDEKVTITLREFYSYKDIITHKLSTTSNGEQLVTAGMIHVSAFINGRKSDLATNKTIRWFIPDTSSAIGQMQLFEGKVNSKTSSDPYLEFANDSLQYKVAPGMASTDVQINWSPRQAFFSNIMYYTSVKVLYLRDAPFATRTSGDGMIAKFYISSGSKIPKREMVETLREKYGYYKVKIKKRKGKENTLDKFFEGKRKHVSLSLTDLPLGDSAWVDIATANQYRLQASDTLVSRTYTPSKYDFYLNHGRPISPGFQTQLKPEELTSLSRRYSVDINTLGWINCDRFYNDDRKKVNFYVDLPGNAANYQTMLVFDNIRSMIPGEVSGNSVAFKNVPHGQTAKIISLTVKDGKTIAAMAPVVLSNNRFSSLRFEETNPATFREQAGTLDK